MIDTQTRPTRSRKKVILAVVAVVLVIGLAVGLALFQPWKIFTRNTVDEALPMAAGAVATSAGPAVTAPPLSAEVPTTAASLPSAAVVAPPSAAVEPPATAVEPPVTAVEPPVVAVEPPVVTTEQIVEPVDPPATDPVTLASGTFVDGEHATSGTAIVLQLPDGSRFVRLEGFSTSDGPDVDVWLTDQPAGGEWSQYDDGRFVSLGDLKGTDGNQNYPIPADTDLSGLTSVVIWCDRFNVAFGTAAVSL